MFRETPLLELPSLVAELGYEWIELSPRDDFLPFFNHPRVDDCRIAASDGAGCGCRGRRRAAALHWPGPDEDAVWQRALPTSPR